LLVPKSGWTKASDSKGIECDDAWDADVTGMLESNSWPAVHCPLGRSASECALRITDIDGIRYTATSTNKTKGQAAVLDIRHRLRAHCEDRMGNAMDRGLNRKESR
jgi:hypothetical protein